MRTFSLLVIVAVLAITAIAPSGRAHAKGNDGWVLTGGELDDYAMRVTLNLVDGPPGTVVPAPASEPALHYDLLGSWGPFAIPYQLAHGPWARYYPGIGLLRLHGDPAASDTWFDPWPATTLALHDAIGTALAAKAAGQLERSAVAVDFRERSLDKVDYRLSALENAERLPEPYRYAPSNPGTMQISGSASEEFVLRALVDTVSAQPMGTTLMPPAYEITYRGEIRPGSGIGGLLGYYSPPIEEHTGRFWPGDYASDKSTEYYATTTEFDAIIAGMLHRDASGATGASEQSTGHGRARSAEIAAGSALGLAALFTGLYVLSRRRATSRRRRPA